MVPRVPQDRHSHRIQSETSATGETGSGRHRGGTHRDAHHHASRRLRQHRRLVVVLASFAAGMVVATLLAPGAVPGAERLRLRLSGTSTSAQDTFSRTIASGLGSADDGGAWTLAGAASDFSVSGGQGRLSVPVAGTGLSAWLPGVAVRDARATATFTL